MKLISETTPETSGVIFDTLFQLVDNSEINMPIQLKYEPYSSQCAIIGAFDSKIEAVNNIEGVWNFILSMF